MRERFLAELLEDIQNNRLLLPSLPELAIKIRKAVEDVRSSAATVAKIVAIDAALSARLIQVANSAYYKGHAPVEEVPAAVARLGNNVVRNLVTGFALRQLYHVKVSAATKRRLQDLQERNIQVAAYSHVLARKFTSLKPDVAMLGGLLHRIGALPILLRAETVPALLADEDMLEALIDQTHRAVGKAILEAWNFPAHLVAVIMGHEDLQRDAGPQPDYVDVVCVAVLHHYVGKAHALAEVNWEEVTAFTKLGFTPQQHIQAMKEAHKDVLEVQRMLSS